MLNENAIADVSADDQVNFDVVAFVDQLADPAILVGPDRVISAANGHVDRLFGWEETGLAGQLIDVLIPPDRQR
jgi:hypothetical protein